MEATTKQISFITKLAAERDFGPDAPARLVDEARNPVGLDKRQASTLIDWLLKQPRKPQDRGQRLEPGIYVLPDGTIVQAKENQRKTNVYTKRWVVIRGERLVDATEEHVHGEWEYDPGLKARVLADSRVMTLDEAKDFILRYGQCVRCGRRLKAAESVERGIGPVCVTYFEQFAA